MQKEADPARLRLLEALDVLVDGRFVLAEKSLELKFCGSRNQRLIDVPATRAQGRVTLDFNQSYNPPCAFTSFASCPLPPAQNRLDLAIDAGEKAYTGDHGS